MHAVSHHAVDVADGELVVSAAVALLDEDVDDPDADALPGRRGEHPRATHVGRVVVREPRGGYDLENVKWGLTHSIRQNSFEMLLGYYILDTDTNFMNVSLTSSSYLTYIQGDPSACGLGYADISYISL